MRVWIRTPFSLDKNLGKAYNEEMALIPEGDSACFIDGDVMFLTPNFGEILNKYQEFNPNAVLTCYTNRIHQLAKGQFRNDIISTDIRDHMKIEQGYSTVTRMEGPVSGFLLVVPKHVWNAHKFSEKNTYNPDQPNLLGVDNEWTNRIRAHGVPLLRMDGLYVWHTYRILSDGKDKSHLL